MPNLPDIQDNLQDELQDLITCMVMKGKVHRKMIENQSEDVI